MSAILRRPLDLQHPPRTLLVERGVDPSLLGLRFELAVDKCEGSLPAEIKKVAKKEVADEKRKDAALEIVDEWAKEDKKQDKALGKELLKIVTRYDAQRTETEPFMARIDASIHEADRRFLDMRFQLKEQLTKAEWDAAVVRLNQ